MMIIKLLLNNGKYDLRKAKFVRVFVYNKNRRYTKKEWELLKKVDSLELNPPQMKQTLRMKKKI